MNQFLRVLSLVCIWLLYSQLAFSVNQASIIDPGNEWLSHGRTYEEQRFSPLKAINNENVDELDLVWSFPFPTARGMEATPLIHQGVIYISTGWSHVYAIDARNGRQLWHYDAKVDKAHLIRTCCGPVNRGVALWKADDSSVLKVYFGALDGRLIALNAQDGTESWSIQTTPTDGNYSITGAPRVVSDMVIIGNGGAELGARGFVSAYDVNNGEMRWRFYTVPGDPGKPQAHPALDAAVKTWNGDYWYLESGGGGTVWDSIVYDPELDILYFGTGNGSPWNREIRSPGGGDNLYLSSIVAVRPETGEYLWHYQVTPSDNWDYTATQQLVLAEIELKGQSRKVIMQAPKNGFFYVLDRVTGELLSADAYANITWASHVDMETGRPVETEYAKYQQNGGSVLWPAPVGAHNWQPMSYSKQTGLMYIPVQNGPGFYTVDDKISYGVGRWNTGVDFNEIRDPKSWVTAKATLDALIYGELVAWDPVKQSRAWQVSHPNPSNGGILSTAGGLVFQGTQDGAFVAYDAANGEARWKYQSDSAILAGPISYELDGEQYVAVAQGGGGAVMLATGGDHLKNKRQNFNRLLVFKRGIFNQTQALNEDGLRTILALGHEAETDPEVIEQGSVAYERNCSVCHGISAKGNVIVPDLRYMSETTHTQFVAIAYGGLLAHKGMVGFHQSLTFDEINAIHAYLDSEQQSLSERVEMSFGQEIEYWIVYWASKLGERFPSFANFTREYVM